jgi:hypothetical protein
MRAARGCAGSGRELEGARCVLGIVGRALRGRHSFAAGRPTFAERDPSMVHAATSGAARFRNASSCSSGAPGWVSPDECERTPSRLGRWVPTSEYLVSVDWISGFGRVGASPRSIGCVVPADWVWDLSRPSRWALTTERAGSDEWARGLGQLGVACQPFGSEPCSVWEETLRQLRRSFRTTGARTSDDWGNGLGRPRGTSPVSR